MLRRKRAQQRRGKGPTPPTPVPCNKQSCAPYMRSTKSTLKEERERVCLLQDIPWQIPKDEIVCINTKKDKAYESEGVRKVGGGALTTQALCNVLSTPPFGMSLAGDYGGTDKVRAGRPPFLSSRTELRKGCFRQ